MLTHRGGKQGGPGMSSLTISGMAPEVVAHCMDLEVLDVDHAPHDVVQVLHPATSAGACFSTILAIFTAFAW